VMVVCSQCSLRTKGNRAKWKERHAKTHKCLMDEVVKLLFAREMDERLR